MVEHPEPCTFSLAQIINADSFFHEWLDASQALNRAIEVNHKNSRHNFVSRLRRADLVIMQSGSFKKTLLTTERNSSYLGSHLALYQIP
jgi:hypothetical protein